MRLSWLVVGYKPLKVTDWVGGPTCGKATCGEAGQASGLCGMPRLCGGIPKICLWVESAVYREYVLGMEHSGSVLRMAGLQLHQCRLNDVLFKLDIISYRIPPSSHQLHQIIRRPPRLRKTQTALYTLQKLPRHLIAHNMRRIIALVQLLPRAPLMDPHHRHPNRPRRLPNRQPQIPVVGIDVAFLLRRHHYFHHRGQDPVFQRAGLEFPE